MTEKKFLMVLVQQKEMPALLRKELTVGFRKGINRTNDHYERLFLPGEGKGEVHPLLSLVTEGFPEGHPVGPGRLQRGVSYFDQ